MVHKVQMQNVWDVPEVDDAKEVDVDDVEPVGNFVFTQQDEVNDVLWVVQDEDLENTQLKWTVFRMKSL